MRVPRVGQDMFLMALCAKGIQRLGRGIQGVGEGYSGGIRGYSSLRKGIQGLGHVKKYGFSQSDKKGKWVRVP